VEVDIILLSRKEIDRTINNVIATLGFEGLKMSTVVAYANRQMLKGEISGEEARNIIMYEYKLKVK